MKTRIVKVIHVKEKTQLVVAKVLTDALETQQSLPLQCNSLK